MMGMRGVETEHSELYSLLKTMRVILNPVYCPAHGTRSVSFDVDSNYDVLIHLGRRFIVLYSMVGWLLAYARLERIRTYQFSRMKILD